MGCNCGKKKRFLHTDKAGNTTEVATQAEALRLIREKGGTYKLQ
jgi:hypothetical protein